MKQIVLLGSTGSIGDSVCSIVRKHPDSFRFYALTAHGNWKKAVKLAHEFLPELLIITDKVAYQFIKKQSLPEQTQLHFGSEVLTQIVKEQSVDLVVAGIVGSAGMPSVLAAVASGKTLLLANKESIVSAGELVMPLAKKTGATIIPLDSEHNALFQCLPNGYQIGTTPRQVDHITLTASGGPFWSMAKEAFIDITPEQALAHPKWNMGAKISVDSATMMNKGLEVIEAHWLFNMPESKIDVVVHPQSAIHSMVHFIDGSILAQLGPADMQIPISFGMGLRHRLSNGVGFLDLIQLAKLEFFEPNGEKFPCLSLAREAINIGGTMPAVLNAANEVAVAAFLSDQVGFMEIPVIIQAIMQGHDVQAVESLGQLEQVDIEVRTITDKLIQRK